MRQLARLLRRLMRRPAPIVADSSKVEAGHEYREPGDPENLVRFRAVPPTGSKKRLLDFVSVAGISKGTQLIYAEQFIEGSDRSLTLEHDPTNEYDRNAIRVMGRWRSDSGKHRLRQIGWVPRDFARRIARKCRDGEVAATLVGFFRPHGDKSPGIRMDIWEIRQQSGQRPKKPASR